MFLALRELKHAKLRYFLIGLIMVLIAWLVLFVSGLAKGLSSDNASSIQKMDIDYLVIQKEADNRLVRSILSEGKLKDIRNNTNNESAAPLGVQMTTFTQKGSSKKIDTTFFAVDMKGFLAPDVIDGRMINNKTTNEIVVDSALKEDGLKLGDYIKEQFSGKTFEIVGFSKGESFSHTPVIHINFKEWGEIHKLSANKQLFFNAIALKTSQDAAEQIDKNVTGVDLIDKSQALKGIPGYSEEQGSLIMMIAFLFIIAAFVLAVFFYVMTIQKINQFGVLKAIGATTGYLARNIVFQVLLLTFISLVISIVLTYGVAATLPSSMPFELTPRLVLGSSGLFLAVSVIGSLISLYKVSKIDAIEAIGSAAQ
ncbi:ABC transporter permease [Bacillus atrophaeus]|uniref:ABC transporter permease n=1 Tax=Bacillus atrophaeus TaxID=1452 RepID=UPI000D03BE47|nr:ABC transporter permease [Bacillus atrophaeus]MED1122758.1 ABC transporter permease [Bacillus atrophaeus]PRS02587.1 ABC transporter permease [Bacillus atrophaeus]PSA92953.1 ABC transporter permease [Bacillus atrophaeus]PSA93897.1 ABC transporter permease [Bacillus atrophaeus]